MKRLLLLVAGACFSMAPAALAQSGTIDAEPNPCHMEGRDTCTTFVRWETQGVAAAKVFVIAEGRHTFQEKEFSASLHCERHRCAADWIRPETRYIFKLYDFTRGDRGRLLGSVTISGR